MNRLCLGLAAVIALGLAAPVVAQARVPFPEQYRLRVEYRFFPNQLTGEIQNGFGDISGTLIDVEADLGIPENDTWQGLAVYQFKPGHKIRGSYTPLDYDGIVIAGRDLTFGETTFLASSRLVTSMKGVYYTGAYEYDFVSSTWGFIGGLIGAKVFDVDTLLVGPEQGLREQETLRTPIPVLGLVSRFYVGGFSVEGEVSGVTLGSRGHLLEADASARIHVSDRLAVTGGYRKLLMKGVDEPDTIDIGISGWTWGFELSL
jgi:hypothetical protein